MESPVRKKSYDFALEAIGLFRILQAQKEYVLSKQFLKSATSIGANVEEANAAQSKRDFLSKMSIAAKEARETHYWLRLLQDSQIIEHDFSKSIEKTEELIRILTSIVKTTSQQIKSE